MHPESMEGLYERFGPAYRWLVTVTCLLGGMTAIMANSTVNVTFPDIMGTFGIGRDQAQLISTGFFAAMTAGMVLSAWITESIGERRSYAISLITFLVGAAMSGLAQNTDTLLVGRVLQGMAAGAIHPLTMGVVFKAWPEGRKGTAMGVYGMGMVLAPTLGPTAGGLAIELFNWRYAFLLTLPTVFLSLLMCYFFMPSKDMPNSLPKFDFFGFFCLCGSLSGLLLGFSYGQRLGWTSNEIILMFTVGAVGFGLFIHRQLYGPAPLINLRVFANIQFTAAALVALVSGCVFMASTLLLPLFTQQIQGLSAFNAGLLMMPGGLSLFFLSPIAGRLSDSLPPEVLIYLGLLGFALAFYLLAGADVNTPFWTLVTFTIFIRIGTAFTRPVINSTALKALPRELVHQGSSAVNFMRQLGAAIGTNGVFLFLELRVPFYAEAYTATQSSLQQTGRVLQDEVIRLFTEAGVPTDGHMPGVLDHLGRMILAQANTQAFQDTFVVLAIVSIAGLIPAWYMAQKFKD